MRPVFTKYLFVAVAIIAGTDLIAAEIQFLVAGSHDNCLVRVVSSSGETASVKCGETLRLGEGTYDVWAESLRHIVPYPTSVTVAGTSRATIRLPSPSFPAGRVHLPRIPTYSRIELVHLQQHKVKDQVQRVFRRSVQEQDEVRMPTGEAVALALDRKGSPVAITRPFSVSAREAIALQFEVPSEASILLDLSTPTDLSMSDFAVTSDGDLPDRLLTSADRLVALWYEQDIGEAELILNHESHYWEPSLTQLEPKSIYWARDGVREKPTLHVAITTTDPLAVTEELELSMEGDRSTSPPVLVQLGANVIQHVPPFNLLVKLQMGEWEFTQQADLSAGDASLTFELRPIVITGVLTYDGEPARGEVAFTSDRKHATLTDDQGDFQVTLWGARRYGVAISLLEHPEVPLFTDTVRVSADRHLRIDIPRATMQVKAVDATTGQGIAGATVTYKNTWEDEAEGTRGNMMQLSTNDLGEVLLPPLRKGTVEIIATAGGFEPSEPIRRRTADVQTVVQVPLSPATGTDLSLVLPDGSPAAGAEAIGVAGTTVVWSRQADPSGLLKVPTEFSGVIAARHAQSAGVTVRWHSGTRVDLVQLKNAAPSLRLQVVDKGGQPVGGAWVVVWFGETPVTDAALSFLTQTPATTPGAGWWIGRNLPAAPVRILALRSADALPQASVGAYDRLATVIQFPWRNDVKVTVLD